MCTSLELARLPGSGHDSEGPRPLLWLEHMAAWQTSPSPGTRHMSAAETAAWNPPIQSSTIDNFLWGHQQLQVPETLNANCYRQRPLRPRSRTLQEDCCLASPKASGSSRHRWQGTCPRHRGRRPAGPQAPPQTAGAMSPQVATDGLSRQQTSLLASTSSTGRRSHLATGTGLNTLPGYRSAFQQTGHPNPELTTRPCSGRRAIPVTQRFTFRPSEQMTA
mmetsp:Transcript_10538/g.24767  ORF Transcript_10538/g.24767 Transcript_10538/m.24767 type:complete len:220 (-) Transcript_10538:832-1491(-)